MFQQVTMNTSTTFSSPVAPGQLPPPGAHAAYCDHCRNYIIGVRYRCSMCTDYDLCAQCYDSCPARQPGQAQFLSNGQSVHDPSHLFLRIDKPGSAFDQYPTVANRTALVHVGQSCSSCNCHPIVGVLYQCQQCPGLNLCESCEAKGTHDPRHSRIKHTMPHKQGLGQQAPAPTVGMFGQQAPPPAVGMFGQQAPAPAVGMFGQQAAPPAADGGSGQPDFPPFFGNNPAAAAMLFPKNGRDGHSLYSTLAWGDDGKLQQMESPKLYDRD